MNLLHGNIILKLFSGYLMFQTYTLALCETMYLLHYSLSYIWNIHIVSAVEHTVLAVEHIVSAVEHIVNRVINSNTPRKPHYIFKNSLILPVSLWILKPQSVIPREEGGLGFLIITRAQPEGWLKTLIPPTPEVLQIEVLISRGHQCS